MDNFKTLHSNSELLTTGQAAALCSVTRNAVFKWIQSGQLSAHRTAGGHHRIDRRELERLINSSSAATWRKTPPVREPQYCWEYNGKGKAQAACLDCAVYALRALRCYEVAKLSPGLPHAKLFCRERCEDCDYYKEMHGKIANILIVTNDRVLTNNLIAEADGARFNLEITDCEYSCSAIINHFKPDFVIVDCILGRQVSRQISRHIMEDPRIPYVRVIFAGSKEEYARQCDREVFARITRPFAIGDIEECIHMIGNKGNSLIAESGWLNQSPR